MNILLTVPAGEQLLPYLTTMVGEQDKINDYIAGSQLSKHAGTEGCSDS